MVLAILISFLLTPAVTRLERWGLHPGLAVLSTVAIAFALIGAIFATVSVQAVDLTNSLPKYRGNIEAKWAAIQKGPSGPLDVAFRNVGELLRIWARFGIYGSEGPEPTKFRLWVV